MGAAMGMLSMLKVGYTVLRSETPATDLVNTFMDWAARRSLLLIVLFMPPYYVYKLAASAAATVAPEDVAGKVVLITGASSGIGEVRTVGDCCSEFLFFEKFVLIWCAFLGSD